MEEELGMLPSRTGNKAGGYIGIDGLIERRVQKYDRIFGTFGVDTVEYEALINYYNERLG